MMKPSSSPRRMQPTVLHAPQIPHPNGIIKVSYEQNKKGLSAVIIIPEQTTGTLVWKEKEYALASGKNELKTE